MSGRSHSHRRGRGAAAIVAGVAGVLATLLTPAPAHAIVRMRTGAGTPVEWRRTCPMLILEGSENPRHPHAELAALVEEAAGAWTGAACTALPLELRSGVSDHPRVSFDGDKTILWRMEGFCADAANADDEVCLSPNAVAVTTLFFYDKPGAPEDGEIIDADLELNEDAFDFVTDGSGDGLDLESILTHELGHVLGLDHSCNTVPGTAVVDMDGQAVPRCFPTSALSDDVVDATMFPYTAAGETGRRAPISDELGAVCAIYGAHSGECSDIEPDCSCRVGRGARTLPLVLSLLLGLMSPALIAGLVFGAPRAARTLRKHLTPRQEDRP